MLDLPSFLDPQEYIRMGTKGVYTFEWHELYPKMFFRDMSVDLKRDGRTFIPKSWLHHTNIKFGSKVFINQRVRIRLQDGPNRIPKKAYDLYLEQLQKKSLALAQIRLYQRDYTRPFHHSSHLDPVITTVPGMTAIHVVPKHASDFKAAHDILSYFILSENDEWVLGNYFMYANSIVIDTTGEQERYKFLSRPPPRIGLMILKNQAGAEFIGLFSSVSCLEAEAVRYIDELIHVIFKNVLLTPAICY
uniref:AlNc14C118G6590 protein n=1 Tax=Albugo laibachii Nc14 TaxID=890382 RepID=F0WJ59_9STRA|nr:AlNc14C118G6590 [Albugo laibachii Nc14]|eukprot:CCA21305.1 AlNc14C118G6590 [Albugo laibachii Nc14]